MRGECGRFRFIEQAIVSPALNQQAAPRCGQPISPLAGRLRFRIVPTPISNFEGQGAAARPADLPSFERAKNPRLLRVGMGSQLCPLLIRHDGEVEHLLQFGRVAE